MKKNKGPMTTEQYLAQLELEERRSRLLRDFAKDPAEAKREAQRNIRIRKLISRIQKMAGVTVEKAIACQNVETAEKNLD